MEFRRVLFRSETMFAAQFDLFGTPILPGFHYGETIVTADEERALIASIDSAGLSPFRFQGWFGKRLTASFGWCHDFDTARFDPTEQIGSASCREREFQYVLILGVAVAIK